MGDNISIEPGDNISIDWCDNISIDPDENRSIVSPTTAWSIALEVAFSVTAATLGFTRYAWDGPAD